MKHSTTRISHTRDEMTTGLLLRADDGFSIYAGTVWPITDGYDTAYAYEGYGTSSRLGQLAEWGLHHVFQDRKGHFIAYKSLQTFS